MIDPAFPLCVKCQHGHGVPIVVATVADQPMLIRITVRCDDCGDTWHFDRTSEIDIRQKADRRESMRLTAKHS